MTKHAASMSTYFRTGLDPRRLDIFKKSITSLLESGYPSKVNICDDGSDEKHHLEFATNLNDNRIVIHERIENGGYSKIKNLGINAILSDGNDFGFLIDDDVGFKKDWWEQYVRAYEWTKIGHFCFIDYDVNAKRVGIRGAGELVYSGGYVVRNISGMYQGGMMTFDRKLIEDIGYFRIFPRKLGHEHSAWTTKMIARQAIPFPADVINSNEFLYYIDADEPISTRPADFWDQANENMRTFNDRMDINEPCIT